MSVLEYIISNKKFPDDFVDSNIRVSYNQIAYIFGDNYEKRDEVIRELTDTKTISFQIEKKKLFDLKDYKSGKYINDCLYYHGLITNTEYPDEYVVPNLITYEMLLTYFERIMDFELDGHDKKKFMLKFLKSGDLDLMVDEFFKIIIQEFPGDFFKNVNESFYHGLFFIYYIPQCQKTDMKFCLNLICQTEQLILCLKHCQMQKLEQNLKFC